MKYMTMQQFLQNPSGSYSAYFYRRDLIIEGLNHQFYELIKNRKKDFKIKVFKNKDNYYFYITIPSTKYDELVYDTVIKFIPINKEMISDFSFNRYAIKVFSNSPNFLFTYAYVYNKDNILIKFLKKKIDKEALTKKPNIKNPLQSYGFEKSIYFALLFIKLNRFNIKSKLASIKVKNLNQKYLLDNIKSCKEKLDEYNKIKAKLVQENKLKKNNSKKILKEEKTKKLDKLQPKGMNRKINFKRDMHHDMKHDHNNNNNNNL